MIIYKATNKINGKSYIGQTIDSLRRRKNNHLCKARKNKDNFYFHSALKKYGSDNFNWEILHKCNTIEEASELEIYYIGLYNTFENGYNLTLGGRNHLGFKHSNKTKRKISEAAKGRKPSEETRKKMSRSQMGNKHLLGHRLSEKHKRKLANINKNNKYHLGKKHTEETKQKMSIAGKGRIFSNEHKQKISESQKGENNSMYGKRGEDNPFYGKRHTNKTIKKLSTPVIINNKRFDSLKNAAIYLSTTPGAIFMRLKRKWEGYYYVEERTT